MSHKKHNEKENHNLKDDWDKTPEEQIPVLDDGLKQRIAALELEQADVVQIQINMDSATTWQAAGLNVVATPDLPTDQDSIDYLFFVHDRHDGNRAAAQRYLDWEVNLLNQIDEQERSSYRLPH